MRDLYQEPRALLQAWLLQPAYPAGASVPLAPRQGDLRHVDIATVEDTLGSVHWDVDNCPVAMELNEPAAPPEAPLARRKHPAASTAQRAANEDDPGFYPLRVIYGGHCPPWSRVGQSFLWIGTPMT